MHRSKTRSQSLLEGADPNKKQKVKRSTTLHSRVKSIETKLEPLIAAKEEAEDDESSLDSIEQDELRRKLQKMAKIIQMWMSKQGLYKDEVRRLLTIKGNYRNCDSIFQRLGISPHIDLDQVLEDEDGVIDVFNN